MQYIMEVFLQRFPILMRKIQNSGRSNALCIDIYGQPTLLFSCNNILKVNLVYLTSHFKLNETGFSRDSNMAAVTYYTFFISPSP